MSSLSLRLILLV